MEEKCPEMQNSWIELFLQQHIIQRNFVVFQPVTIRIYISSGKNSLMITYTVNHQSLSATFIVISQYLCTWHHLRSSWSYLIWYCISEDAGSFIHVIGVICLALSRLTPAGTSGNAVIYSLGYDYSMCRTLIFTNDGVLSIRSTRINSCKTWTKMRIFLPANRIYKTSSILSLNMLNLVVLEPEDCVKIISASWLQITRFINCFAWLW